MLPQFQDIINSSDNFEVKQIFFNDQESRVAQKIKTMKSQKKSMSIHVMPYITYVLLS